MDDEAAFQGRAGPEVVYHGELRAYVCEAGRTQRRDRCALRVIELCLGCDLLLRQQRVEPPRQLTVLRQPIEKMGDIAQVEGDGATET